MGCCKNDPRCYARAHSRPCTCVEAPPPDELARLRARVEELEQVQGVGAEEYLVMRHRAHEAERLLKTSNDEVAERERDEARTALRALANEARWAFFHGNVCAAEQWNASETRKTVLRAEEILSNEGGE